MKLASSKPWITELSNNVYSQNGFSKSTFILNRHLFWKSYIKPLTKRIQPFVPTTTLQFIFNSLIQPHKFRLLLKLQELQNRAARVLTFSNYDTRADPLIQKLGWKKLQIQRKIQKAFMVYKWLRGLTPRYLRSLFTD